MIQAADFTLDILKGGLGLFHFSDEFSKLLNGSPIRKFNLTKININFRSA